jgi:nicotinamidase-related amidase
MLTIDPKRSLLLVVDFQSRLMPAIDKGETVVRNANRLIAAAKLFGIPRLFTEQNAKGLGPIVGDVRRLRST